MTTINDIEQINPAEVAQFSAIHIEATVRDLQRILLRSMADTARLDTLRELAEYGPVALYKDDATCIWSVSVGASQPHMTGHGDDLRDAIDNVGGGT